MSLVNSILTPTQQSLVNELAGSLDSTQKVWLSGYFAGLAGSGAAAPVAAAKPKNTLVLFGTESGNAEGLASKTAKAAKKAGAKVTLKNMNEIAPADLAKYEVVLTIVSTWGDGDPPESAEGFYNALLADKVDLSKVEFSLCALGDTSYDKFCETGKIIDARLAELGATRLVDRADCDVDFDDAYDAWLKANLEKLAASATVAAPVASGAAAPAVEYGRKNPFPAEVIENQIINGEGSSKETIHLELNLEGSGLTYEAGDALAVIPTNAPEVVADILKVTGFAADEKVTVKGFEESAFEKALSEQLDITALSKSVIRKYNEVAKSDELAALLADDAKEQLKDYIWGRQLVDLLEAYPAKELTAQSLVGILRKLPPRLYSIASSPKAHEGEVHLTVAAVRYNSHGKDRKGVASTYIADEAKAGEKVSVYVHTNKNFRLPTDSKTPVIMVGPGTGIAPFRAFIEERGETGNEGGSWLFFGDQRYTYDFLYQLELQDHLKEGGLTKLDVAFSRDQPEKVYVQDKMREQAEELFQWLEKGAHFYVCGDASRMANDVNTALLDIIKEQGGKSDEDAAAYLDQLKKDKRYQRDVY